MTSSVRNFLNKLQKSENVLFFREFLKHPTSMGALFRSSKRLADNVAKEIPENCPGLIVELGGGTGVVTDAILRHGFPHDKIIVIEKSSDLVKHLRKRFPKLKIVHGDAAELDQLVGKNNPVSVVVSGLPLRTLPPPLVQSIASQITKLLKPGDTYIQFTYAPYKSPFRFDPPIHFHHSKRVWRHVPPARIDIYNIQ